MEARLRICVFNAMSKFIQIGEVKIPLTDFVVSRSAILGITKSGKTYTAKGIAEQLLEHDIPIVVFDAIGVWRFLKVAGDGAHSKGFKLVVAGGMNPDLPLTPDSAPEIVRAAIKENIPLIIDLYDPKLSKADWRRIVQKCCHVLLYENVGLRHIFIEEAAEYVPQTCRDVDGVTFAAVEKVARMGGNKSLGITFINQRSQEVNKSVLELCDNLVLLRQRGSHAIDSLEKWLDRLSPDTAAEIAKSMPQMTQGDCWVFSEDAEIPIRTRSKTIKSFHPDRRTPEKLLVSKPTVNTDEFVNKLSSELKVIIEQDKANDPALLKKKIGELERRLKIPPSLSVKTETKEIPVLVDTELHHIKIAIHSFEEAEKLFSKSKPIIEQIGREISKFTELVGKNKNHWTIPAPQQLARTPVKVQEKRATVISRPVPNNSENGEIRLSGGPLAVLKSIAQYPEGVSDAQIGVLTGYKKTSRTVFKQKLSSAGLISKGGRGYIATPDGVSSLGDNFEPLPTGDLLRNHWLDTLTGGELECFKVYVQQFPNDVEIDELMNATGYLKTSVTVFRQKLKARNLIEGKQASAHLF